MIEFTHEVDIKATHTALRMRNNVLPLATWAEVLELDAKELEGIPSPITYGRLKFLLTQAHAF